MLSQQQKLAEELSFFRQVREENKIQSEIIKSHMAAAQRSHTLETQVKTLERVRAALDQRLTVSRTAEKRLGGLCKDAIARSEVLSALLSSAASQESNIKDLFESMEDQLKSASLDPVVSKDQLNSALSHISGCGDVPELESMAQRLEEVEQEGLEADAVFTSLLESPQVAVGVIGQSDAPATPEDNVVTPVDSPTTGAGEATAMGGIGMSFSTGNDGRFYVTGLRPGSPAAASGLLKLGDVVVGVEKINLETAKNKQGKPLDQSEVAQMLRGPVGSLVRMTILRPDELAAQAEGALGRRGSGSTPAALTVPIDNQPTRRIEVQIMRVEIDKMGAPPSPAGPVRGKGSSAMKPIKLSLASRTDRPGGTYLTSIGRGAAWTPPAYHRSRTMGGEAGSSDLDSGSRPGSWGAGSL
mmetsp:Transcript_19082/g.29827  ORF Transcript_19082/g.29827 Transcript_19082/m.29827 type:complete len:413 (+) Transcript_19082:149-1387(+)